MSTEERKPGVTIVVIGDKERPVRPEHIKNVREHIVAALAKAKETGEEEFLMCSGPLRVVRITDLDNPVIVKAEDGQN